MFRRLLVIDLVLILLLVFGSLRIRKEWVAFWATHQVGNIQATAETISALPAAPPVVPWNFSEWTDIAARNPFSFDRTDVPIIVAPSVVAENVGPKPILFGIMSLGKEPLAVMAPGQTAENRFARPLHVGESLGGWELVEIDKKSVVVRAGSRRENVIMDDPTAQVPRGAERTANGGGSGSVVQTGPAAPPQGASSSRAPLPNGDLPPPPPTPVDASGQPKKGRWVRSPFGDVFVEEDR